jgi:hypothetical protein
MDLGRLTVMGIVAVALSFDYTNGFHDSANSIDHRGHPGAAAPAGAAVGGAGLLLAAGLMWLLNLWLGRHQPDQPAAEPTAAMVS